MIAGELRRTLDWVQSQDELLFSRTPAARELWNDGYVALSQGREDAFGAATSRAEAQVLRLSAIYAALDRTPLIDACHLQAALAVWDYCRASARLLFDYRPHRSHRPTHRPGAGRRFRGTNQNADSRSFPSPCQQRTN